MASRGNNPPPVLSAVAAAKAAAAERTQRAEKESQGAQHSRLGSSAAMWTRFNTVVEAEEASGSPQQQPTGRSAKRNSPGHNRTLSDIPAEDRSDSVLQEYDTMVRQYHDYVTARDKLGLDNDSEPEDRVAPMAGRPRLDRKPLRNFSRTSNDEPR